MYRCRQALTAPSLHLGRLALHAHFSSGISSIALPRALGEGMIALGSFAARVPRPALRLAKVVTARHLLPAVNTGDCMGQALSLLPPPLGRRSVAARAKAARAPIDRPGEEDPDLWMICGLGNPGPR